ncbi:uncharacterized protein LOC119987430 [Tripterygium wilfordii]|nr:uncharacterized protein LOC119987430 [Tripterygium wilfordii]
MVMVEIKQQTPNHDQTQVEWCQNCLENLPEDITKTMIFQTLTLSDQIRVSIVSKSCRDQIRGICPVSQLPWLLLPHDDLGSKKLSFFDMSAGRVHDYDIPSQLQGGTFCGSSKGWLVFTKAKKTVSSYFTITFTMWWTDEEPTVELEIFLFNPISKSVHQLPSLQAPTNPAFDIFCQIVFVQLSSTDLTDCIVSSVIYMGDYDISKLGFCRPGVDDHWSILDGQENYDYVDTLFWNGTLCVLRARTNDNENVEKFTFKFGGGCEVNINMIPCDRDEPQLIYFMFFDDENDIGVDHENDIGINDLEIDIGVDQENDIQIDEGEEDDVDDYMGISKNYLKDQYLLESTNGELLMIMKISDVYMNYAQTTDIEHSDETLHYVSRKTSGFEVFKMDSDIGQFRRVDDISDQVIFLTLFGSQSCSANDFEGVRGNCIYFVEDTKYIGYENSIAITSRESGVYYLDERKIERSIPNVVDSNPEDLMSWFMPYL